MSRSRASTKSLSYPVLSNLLVSGSVTAAGDLFCIGKKKKRTDSKLYFLPVREKQKLDSTDILWKANTIQMMRIISKTLGLLPSTVSYSIFTFIKIR